MNISIKRRKSRLGPKWFTVCLSTALLCCSHCLNAKTQLSRDAEKRVLQVPELVAQLPESLEDVIALLRDADKAVANETLQDLSKQETLPKRVRTVLVELISADDPQVRASAIECLSHAKISDPAESAAVKKALSDPDATVRMAALLALPTLDSSQDCDLERVMQALKDPEIQVALAAAKVLPKLACEQANAVPVLVGFAKTSPSRQLRLATLDALGAVRTPIDPTTDVLLEIATRDGDPEIRRRAVRDLQNVQLEATKIASLLPLLKDSCSGVRQSLAYTLVLVGKEQPNALQMFAELQNDADEGVRDSAAAALRYGSSEETYFSLLAVSLGDKSLEVRSEAANSLLKIVNGEETSPENDTGPKDVLLGPGYIWPAKLIDAVVSGLDQRESSTPRENLADAIRLYGTYEARLVTKLQQMSVNDPEKWARQTALRALSSAPTTASVLSTLIAGTRDREAVVRRQAVIGIGLLSSDEWPLSEMHAAVPEHQRIELALYERLLDPSPTVRGAALKAFEKLGSKTKDSRMPLGRLSSTKARIVKELKDEDPAIRKQAASAIGELYNDDATTRALLGTTGDPDPDVGTQAAKSLANVDFFNEEVEQAVGKRQITFWDFTTREKVVAKSARELRGIKGRCDVIDGLIDSLGRNQSSEVHLEELHSLAEVSENARALLRALEEGEVPEDSAFIAAADEGVNVCAPVVQKAEGVFIKGLHNVDPEIRAVSASAVGKLRVENNEVSAELSALIKDSNREVRKAAAVALGDLVEPDSAQDTKAIAGTLLAATTDSDSEVRKAAVEGIVQLKSVQALQQAFPNTDPAVREAVVSGFTELNTPFAEVEEVIAKALGDNSRSVRLQALQFVNGKGNGALSSLRGIVPLLSDENAEIRASAAKIVGFYRKDASFAVGDLSRLLVDEASEVRSAAADSLGWIGPAARASIPGLIALLPDSEVGDHAKVALEQIGESALAALNDAIHNQSNEGSERAKAAVALINGERTLQPLTITLKDGDHVTIQRPAVVIGVATWCPYSTKLRAFLLRDDVQAYFKDTRLYFLLEDETKEVMEHINEAQGWSPDKKEAVAAEAKSRLKDSGLFDKDFLSGLPGQTFQVQALSKLRIPAFPYVLNPASPAMSADSLSKESWLSIHDWVNSEWFSLNIDMPDHMKSELKRISGGSLLF